jgi:hypothetical protein
MVGKADEAGGGPAAPAALTAAPELASSFEMDDKLPFPLVAQALQALQDISAEIARRLQKLVENETTVLVADTGLVGRLEAYRSFRDQLEAVIAVDVPAIPKAAVGKGGTEGLELRLPVLDVALQSAAAMLSYAKVAQDIKNTELDLTDDVLTASLCGALLGRGLANVHVPVTLPGSGKLRDLLARALQRQALLRAQVLREPENTAATAVADALKAFLDLLSAKEGEAWTWMGALQQACAVDALIEARESVVLLTAQMVKAGGRTTTTRSLFTVLGFGVGPRHSGGASVSFRVSRLKPAPNLIAADVLYAMTPEAPFRERRYDMYRTNFG